MLPGMLGETVVWAAAPAAEFLWDVEQLYDSNPLQMLVGFAQNLKYPMSLL